MLGETLAVCPDPILLIASNPVDVMTQVSQAIWAPSGDSTGSIPGKRANGNTDSLTAT